MRGNDTKKPVKSLQSSKNPYLFALFLSLLNYKTCPVRFPVPKSQNKICIFNNLQISQKRCFSTILLIIRQKFFQRNPPIHCILSGAMIDPPCTAGDDFRNLQRNISVKIIYC